MPFQSHDTKNNKSNECLIRIYLEIEFLQWTWLQGTIESNTRAELLDVFEKWNNFALERLPVQKLLIPAQQQHHEQNRLLRDVSTSGSLSIDISADNLINLMSGKINKPKSLSRNSSIDNTRRAGISEADSDSNNNIEIQDGGGSDDDGNDSIYGSEEELFFL